MDTKPYVTLLWLLLSLVPVGMTGCSGFLPSLGASRSQIAQSAKKMQDADSQNLSSVVASIEIVDVNRGVTQQLLAQQHHDAFASLQTASRQLTISHIGPGDILEVTIWETPPAALFYQAATAVDNAVMLPSVNATRFPEQTVTSQGTISLPFVGNITVAGLTTQEIEKLIQHRLKGKANAPQVMARRLTNVSSTVTVVGEVNKSTIVPLTPRHERILDILAAAEGVKQEINKLTIQLTRGGQIHSMPLENVIADNSQNIAMQPGDVVTVLYQPLSFTALGASGLRNSEVAFEAKGITLAQALARAGGLRDGEADPKGVFIFRYESAKAIQWPTAPTVMTPDGKVPVIYRIDLNQASTFFAAQSFPIHDKDILYVSTAPSVQLQKFLALLSTVVSPAMSTTTQVHTISRD